MQKIPLYKALARLVGAYHRCLSPDANESQRSWADKHRDRVEELVKEHMPSGSGFDSGTKLDLDESTENRLVFHTSFHHMNENGFYDGWTEHSVHVTPHLAFDFRLRITGRNRNDIKDYMHDLFHDALLLEVSEYRNFGE
jgi:hypothetical protein